MPTHSESLRSPTDFVSDPLLDEMDAYTVTAAAVVFEYIDSNGEPQLLISWDNQSSYWTKQGMVAMLKRDLDNSIILSDDSQED